jgi:hypothetical protein
MCPLLPFFRHGKVNLERRLSVRSYLLLLFLVLSLLMLFLYQDIFVYAEGDPPTFSVSTPVDSIIINNSNVTTLEILAANVNDMVTFEIILAYDPSITHLEGWALGELVSSFTWKLAEETTPPGHFRLSYSTLGGEPVSGQGILLQLFFCGVASGESDITITSAYYTDTTGKKTYPSLISGTLTVGYHTALVSGPIFLQGRVGRGGVPASLGTGGTYLQGPYDALSLPVLGANLDFGPVVSGDTYTFSTTQPGYLNPQKNLTLSADLTLPPLRLLAGDVTGDQAVTTADLDAIRAAFGSIGAGLAADLNGDGVVDLRDLALAGGNYGLTAAEAYAGWQD